jgi:signal transduction histidine kinase
MWRFAGFRSLGGMTSQPFSTPAGPVPGLGRPRYATRGMRLGVSWPWPTRAELAARNEQLGSALAVSTAQLYRQAAELRHQADELQASRARIVTAGDCERRRIERNLHDGAQQRLAALAIKLNLAAELAGPGAGEVRSLLAELCHDVRDTAEELRQLAHGIYPPLLAECGLAAALTAAAGRSAIPAEVEASSLGRYPSEVEATVYF